MSDVISSRFTVGVFQNVEWAERGVEALRQRGFAPEALTIIAKEAPDVADLVRRSLGSDGPRIDINGLGASVATGSMVSVLQGQDAGLAHRGLAAVMRRVGFQAHDGRIFETLTARGGVLLAVDSEPRSADALATLHAYGGGNAAIGAWGGRV